MSNIKYLKSCKKSFKTCQRPCLISATARGFEGRTSKHQTEKSAKATKRFSWGFGEQKRENQMKQGTMDQNLKISVTGMEKLPYTFQKALAEDPNGKTHQKT